MAENTYENNYISLFSGYGGLDLAVRCALPEARCVCFVEREAPAAAILADRMEDGGLEDAPVKVVDASKCRLCDEPRLPYGVMCRQCLRNYETERRRKAGAKPRSTVCESPGCGQPKATPHGKFCRTCYDQRQEAKVKAASRAKMSTAAKAPEKQIPRRWDTALPGRGVTEPLVGPEAFAPVEPVKPTRPVTRIRAADADEREAREREWAEWLSKRRRDA